MMKKIDHGLHSSIFDCNTYYFVICLLLERIRKEEVDYFTPRERNKEHFVSDAESFTTTGLQLKQIDCYLAYMHKTWYPSAQEEVANPTEEGK